MALKATWMLETIWILARLYPLQGNGRFDSISTSQISNMKKIPWGCPLFHERIQEIYMYFFMHISLKYSIVLALSRFSDLFHVSLSHLLLSFGVSTIVCPFSDGCFTGIAIFQNDWGLVFVVVMKSLSTSRVRFLISWITLLRPWTHRIKLEPAASLPY